MKKYFEDILKSLEEGLPVDWEKVILQVIYGEGSYDIKYYVSSKDVKNVDCFDLGIKPSDLKKIFANVNKTASKLRKSMEKENGLWMTMTLVVDRKGHVKSDFGYEDVNGDIAGYRKSWKKKYLVD